MKTGTPRGPYRHWKQGHRINPIQKKFNIAMGRLSACDRSGDDPRDLLRELKALMEPRDFQKLMEKYPGVGPL